MTSVIAPAWYAARLNAHLPADQEPIRNGLDPRALAAWSVVMDAEKPGPLIVVTDL